MNTNKVMESYLKEINKHISKEKDFKINFKNVESVMFPYFFEWENCVLLKQLDEEELPSTFKPNHFIADRTAFEASYNHVHTTELFEADPLEVLRISLEITKLWKARLLEIYKLEKKFIIIVSFDGEEVVIRLVTVRSNETPWIDLNGLELFSEGILVMEF